MNIGIVHYNTPLLTECLIKSINKFVSCETTIYVFDNSDLYKFKYRQPNIVYIDNTKGQYINFQEFLEKYPNRILSKEGTSKFGSAKHSISIEKLIELINDNFILLDSDILLKRDISELYDENYIFVGEVAPQLLTPYYRVLPYACFLNVKMMKKYNIHYFNENYMHGLHVTEESEKFDTGGGLYEMAKELPHRRIVTNDFLVHYKGGSWQKQHNERFGKNVSPREWLNMHKELWTNSDYANYADNLVKFFKSKNINIDLENPVTIQDKINWLKIYDSTPLKTKCADKIKVHDYCKEKLGKDICIPIIKIYNNTSEINWDELPNQFVIKCNHGSGMNIVVKDKSALNKETAVKKLNKWMNTDFAFQNGYEMHYHNIERKIFVEEYKENKGKKDLVDYKFSCFNGDPKIVQIMNDRFSGLLRINYYDTDFNPLYYSRNDHPANYDIKDDIPKHYDLMLNYSKILAKDFKYVRIDFYEIDDEVYLGELTFTPGSGLFRYKNKEDGIKIGNMLKLSNHKNVVYTCITNNYDKLYDIKEYTPNCDFICFTDNPNLKSRTWQIKLVPDNIKHLSPVKQQRYIKTHPHEVLSLYETSVWVDGSVRILKTLTDFLEKSDIQSNIFSIPTHPYRDCLYEEFEACVEKQKDSYENMCPQIERYKEEGFPTHYGLAQTNIIVRKHNNQSCIDLMNIWWNEIENGSYRDQISFNYAVWKYNKLKINYLDKKLFNSDWFFWDTTHGKLPNNPPVKKEEIKKIETKKIESASFLNTPKPIIRKQSSNAPIIGNTNIKVALVCILKMENHYLLEWVEHYRNLGVDNIIIYDNNDIEGEYKEDIRDISEIASLIDSGYIIHYKVPNETRVQLKYYNQCYEQYKNEYDWFMFFDIDEFLQIDPYLNCNNIKEFLSLNIYDNYNVIHINWKLYDDNDLIAVKNNDYSIQKRFTRELTKIYPNKNYLNKEIKSIIRGKLKAVRFTKNPHTVEGMELNCCNALGQTVSVGDQKSQTIIHKNVWLNHYICKTLEEYINIKLIRKGGFTHHVAGLRYNLNFFFIYNKRTKEKTDYIKHLINENIIPAETVSYSNDSKTPAVKKSLNEPIKKVEYASDVMVKRVETKQMSPLYKAMSF